MEDSVKQEVMTDLTEQVRFEQDLKPAEKICGEIFQGKVNQWKKRLEGVNVFDVFKE